MVARRWRNRQRDSGRTGRTSPGADRKAAGAPGTGRAVAYFDQGVLLYRTGEFARAAECFGKAVILDPAEPSLHYNQGMALMEVSRYREAVACFERGGQAGIRGISQPTAAWGWRCAAWAGTGTRWPALSRC